MTDLWERLAANRDAAGERRITDLFEDERRFADFSAEADGMLLDISKTNIDRAAFDLLLELASHAKVADQRDAMFAGAVISPPAIVVRARWERK